MFYSKSTGGFYTEEIHGDNMPSDVIAITNQKYQELLDGQAQGMVISGDENGNPVLIEPRQLTYAEKRLIAYPSIADQLDLLYHGGYDAWKAAITAVKEEFPK